MAYDGRVITNYILDYCDKRGRKISNLPLQKILYFCHALSLIRFQKPLIKHKFEAWELGPVLQYIDREFKVFGSDSISTRSCKINPQTGASEIIKYEFDEDMKSFLDETIEFYSKMSATALVDLSHVKNGPWYKVWHHAGKLNPGMQIDDTEILGYYSGANKLYIKQ